MSTAKMIKNFPYTTPGKAIVWIKVESRVVLWTLTLNGKPRAPKNASTYSHRLPLKIPNPRSLGS